MSLEPNKDTQYSRLFKRLITATIIIALVSASTLAISKTTHAGLLSFLGSMFSGSSVSAETSSSSGAGSYLLALESLQPESTNPAYNSLSSGSNTPIDDGVTLSADINTNTDVSGTDQVNTQKSTYVVQNGDTLTDIANMFDVSVDTIKQANHMTNSIVKPGDSLVILPVSGILYTVKSGDSMKKIASTYKVDVNDIYTYNDLTESSVLVVGQQLIVPHGKPSITDVTSYLASKRSYVPSFEPLLDAVWNWPSYSGYFVCPVPGSRLTQGLHGHNAVDLAISLGTPIRASAAGTVIISKSNGYYGRYSNGGYGNFVIISHPNGVETLYAHMSKPTVSVGEQVVQGQTIGYIGMTGMTTGPHIHFEIRGAQNPFVDPALCR